MVKGKIGGEKMNIFQKHKKKQETLKNPELNEQQYVNPVVQKVLLNEKREAMKNQANALKRECQKNIEESDMTTYKVNRKMYGLYKMAQDVGKVIQLARHAKVIEEQLTNDVTELLSLAENTSNQTRTQRICLKDPKVLKALEGLKINTGIQEVVTAVYHVLDEESSITQLTSKYEEELDAELGLKPDS